MFVGVVRDRHEGRPVTALSYVAYEPMAEKELSRIAEEIGRRHPQSTVAIQHRLGELSVGDVAVVVVASAPHREDAFAACRDGIELIKARAPIWKREHGPDGAVWVEGCAVAPDVLSC